MDDLQWQYTITPASAEINAEEANEATDIQFVRSAEVAGQSMQLPEADPYGWGTMKEGQSILDRRLEITRTARMRRERAESMRTAERDQEVLDSGELELYSDAPPERQMERAEQIRGERNSRLAGEPGTAPFVASGNNAPRGGQQGFGSAVKFPHTFGGSQFQQDTSTYIPQPPEWRDSPERRAGGPVGQQPQQQSFGQAQVSFDHAVARQLESLAGFVRDATRRIEELECWREALVQE